MNRNKVNKVFKKAYKKGLIIIIIFLTLTVSPSVRAELYPSFVFLNIRAGERIIQQDDFFEIIDLNEYILIPLVSLSRHLEIELNFDRENSILFVNYSETGKSIEIDFQQEIYRGYPEWYAEPPVILEGDFYVSSRLIEELIQAELIWQFRRQILTIEFEGFDTDLKPDHPEARTILARPDEPEEKPDVTGADFSLGSIQYRVQLRYTLQDLDQFEEGDLSLINRINVHGRLNDWALSLGQALNYNFQTENINLSYPFLRARNVENDRLIILGDSSFYFPETIGRGGLRGIYLHYPLRQIRGINSYTSVTGDAEEGSIVRLYVNGIFFAEKNIYQGENSYHFKNVLLRNNRTNIIKVFIEDITGEEKEIVKKIAGSFYIFEDSTSQGLFVLGRVKDTSEPEYQDDLAGLQLKYALGENTSLNLELTAYREKLEDEDDVINLANLLRFAHRISDRPLVLNLDWLAGGTTNLVDHGTRSSLMYTMERGYISASLSYIPPVVTDHVEGIAGGRAAINLQRELANFWLIDLRADTVRSIQDMSELELYRGGLSLSYRDNRRNSFSLSTDIATRDHQIFWEQLDAFESDRNWVSMSLRGSSQLTNTRITGEVNYRTDSINFHEYADSKKLQNAALELDLNSRLTTNLIAAGSFETSAEWFAGELQTQKLKLDGRIRFQLGRNTLTLSGLTERSNDPLIPDSDIEENRREISLAARHFFPGNLTIFGEVNNSYIYFLDDSYLSADAGISYNNPEQNWNINLNLGYAGSIGNRDIPQIKSSLTLTKGFDSGHTASLDLSRDYRSIYQEDPTYQISLSLSQALGFAQNQDKAMGQEYLSNQHNSYIAGVVYLDQNRSGVRDIDDPLMTDIMVFRDGIRRSTDDKGNFKFENIRPGLYEVGIDLRNLSAEYDIVTDSKIVSIRENENIFLEFGITMSGIISGRVFLDSDLTGTFDEGDELISMVGIEIEELNRRVYTRSDGSFYFENIPLGQYNIRVLSGTLPVGMKLADDDSYEVTIKVDHLNIRNLNIPLVYGFN